MSVRAKAETPAIFVPSRDVAVDNEHAPRSGRRRKFDRVEAQLLRWPETMAERRRVMKMWRRIGMGILHRARLSFRLSAVVPDVMIWNEGEIHATNERMAKEAGGCDVKTIQRDVSLFVDLGLFVVSYGWRRNLVSELVRSRTIRLSIPANYSGEVPSDDVEMDDLHTDNRGPHESAAHTDNRCPYPPDNRGPITVYIDRGGVDLGGDHAA